MKCNNCQTILPDGAVFCANCGTRVEVQSEMTQKANAPGSPFIGALNVNVSDSKNVNPQPVVATPAPQPEPQPFTPEPAPMPFNAEPAPMPEYDDKYNTESFGEGEPRRKRSPLVPIIIIAVIVIMLAAAAMFLLPGASESVFASIGGGKYITREAWIQTRYNSEEDETHILYNDKVLGAIDGDYSTRYNGANGTVTAILADDGTLYAVDKNGITEIADDVARLTLSQNGKTIVYADEDNTIYSVSIKGKGEKIISEDQDGFLRSLAVSPDGKSVVFCFEDDGDIYSAAYINNKETELDDEFFGYAILNGGKTIIGSDEEGNGVYIYNTKSEEIEETSDDGYIDYINSDYTEFMYSDNGKYYLYINGESKKIGKYQSIDPIEPYGQDIYDIKTLVGIPLKFTDSKGNYGIGSINKNGEMNEKTDELDTSSFTAFDNAKTIYYTYDGKLYKATEKDEYDPEKIAKDVYRTAFSRDGKKIYYMDNDYTLYLIDGDDETDIEDDVDTLCGVASDGSVYFIIDNELFRYSGGKKAESVADDVSSATISAKYICYYTVDEHGDTTGCYVSKDGKAFTPVFEN